MTPFDEIAVKQAMDEMTNIQKEQLNTILGLAFNPDSPMAEPPPSLLFILGILEGMEAGKIVFVNKQEEHVMFTVLALLARFAPDIKAVNLDDDFLLTEDKPIGVQH